MSKYQRYGVLRAIVPKCDFCSKEMTYEKWKEYFEEDTIDWAARVTYVCIDHGYEFVGCSIWTGGDIKKHKITCSNVRCDCEDR